MIHNPQVLILDEPTTGLDAHLRIEVLNYLKILNKTLNTTIIIVSHDLEVAQYVDRLALLVKGKLVEFSTPANLLSLFFPSNGHAVLMTFKTVTPTLLEQLLTLKMVQYVLKVGRNTLKIFAKNIPQKLDDLIQAIYAKTIEIQGFSITHADFFDYFRIRTRKNYIGT